MITLTRRQARGLRAVFRRSVLGIGRKGPIPPLVLRTGGSQLRAQHRYAGLAVEHLQPDGPYSPEAIALPLDALADVEGRDGSPVVLEALAPDRTVVRWDDHGVPQSREHLVPALDLLAPFPEPPASWATCPPALWSALAEASATASEETARYALNCLLLRGASQEVISTDGHQLMILGGFPFPWSGDVLIKRSPVFASPALPRDRPVSLARAGEFVAFRGGSWTLFAEIQADARFPDVARVLPDAGTAVTRLRLDPEDAAFLALTLDRLPGGDERNAPATVDLNGQVAIRARSADQAQVVEVLLAHSRFTGAPVRFNGNREFLGRAIRLGFTEVEITDADAPIVCRDRDRLYGWQPLSKESAIGPSDLVTRIEPPSPNRRPIPRSDAHPEGETHVNRRTIPTTTAAPSHGTPHEPPVTGESPGPGGLAALIQEAEALHETLTDARGRTGRLIVALRRQRKRARLVASTLASLKQLKLQEVAG